MIDNNIADYHGRVNRIFNYLYDDKWYWVRLAAESLLPLLAIYWFQKNVKRQVSRNFDEISYDYISSSVALKFRPFHDKKSSSMLHIYRNIHRLKNHIKN